MRDPADAIRIASGAGRKACLRQCGRPPRGDEAGRQSVNYAARKRDSSLPSLPVLRLGEGRLTLVEINIGPIEPQGFACPRARSKAGR